MSENSETNLLRAMQLCYLATKRWVRNGYIEIPELDPELTALNNAFIPVIKVEGFVNRNLLGGLGQNQNEQFLGYKLKSDEVPDLAELLVSNPRAYDLVKSRLETNLILSYPLGRQLTQILLAILSGDLERPASHGDRPPVLERNTLLICLAEKVHQDFGFDRASDSLMHTNDGRLLPYAACILWICFELVGLKPYGKKLTAEQVGRILRNNS